MKKKLLCLLMSFTLVFTMIPGTAFAEVADTEPIFQYLAPKTQTTYKQVLRTVNDVESIKAEGNELMATRNRLAAWGAVCALFKAQIGVVIAAAGGTMYLVGDAQVKSLSTVKAGTDHVVEMDFKWTYTNSYPLKGTFRITTYFTYNGEVVGEKRVTYQNREFALGERWDFEEELDLM